MVFEYMDHDLTGLADRPGMRFTVPQIKVECGSTCSLLDVIWYLYLSWRVDLPAVFCPVLHEAAAYGPALLPCQSGVASRYQRYCTLMAPLEFSQTFDVAFRLLLS
jgi:hypothetical protein